MSVMDSLPVPGSARFGLTVGNARAALEHARSHERPQLLAELHGNLASHLWIRLVGEFWTRCDGDRHALSVLMRTFEDWKSLLTSPLERVLWAALPNHVILWRGCFRGLNEDGLSYSVDSTGARQYPLRGRYRRSDAEPVVIRAVVDRSQCAVKVDCGVMEVLVRQAVETRTYRLLATYPVDQFDAFKPDQPSQCWPGKCLRVHY